MCRPLASLLVLALAACGGGSASLAATPTPSTTVIHSAGQGVELRTTRSDPRGEHAMPAGADRVWGALPAAYEALKIPVAMIDSRARLLGNRALKVRGRLGSVRMSEYVDCGERMMGVRNADTYEVTLEIGTQVKPAGADSSTLVTMVQGTARPMAVSGDPVTCATTGELERRIVELVRAELR